MEYQNHGTVMTDNMCGNPSLLLDHRRNQGQQQIQHSYSMLFVCHALLALLICLNRIIAVVMDSAPHCSYNKLKQMALTSHHLLPFYWATAVVLGARGFNTLTLSCTVQQSSQDRSMHPSTRYKFVQGSSQYRHVHRLDGCSRC